MTRYFAGQRRGVEAARRVGLTLLELVVVLAILVVLAGMLVPIISGLGYQTNAATNATVVDEVTRSVRTYHARFDVQPDRWDSLLTSTGTLFSKLHPGLVGGTPSDPARTIVDATPLELDGQQVESLKQAGIFFLYDAVDGQPPNSAHAAQREVLNNGNVVQLSMTSTAADRIKKDAVAVGQSNTTAWNADNKFILLGLGGNSALRGTVATEVPLIQSADPLHNYARVICIYMIPRTGAAASEVFPAVFVGCILPDGTSRTDNLESYNNTRSDGG